MEDHNPKAPDKTGSKTNDAVDKQKGIVQNDDGLNNSKKESPKERSFKEGLANNSDTEKDSTQQK